MFHPTAHIVFFYEINIKATFLTFIHTLPCDGGNMDQSTDYYIAHWKLREKVKLQHRLSI